jgi:pre-mRNA-splicing factor RBM22/SLT11
MSAGMQVIKGASAGKNADEEFPILCETCLGENPYVRMTKEPFGKACKICDRPFCVYRWRPGPRARYKKTELCHTCAKLKNVCQTCVLDLQYGLPVQVRDSTLEEHERTKMPQSDVTLGYLVEQLESQQDTIGGVGPGAKYGKAVEPSKLLSRLSRRTPYYTRNLPHLCSFFAKGECNRGASCPYRHEMPLEKSELSQQNIKDRFYGQNDPVAKKMMRRANADPLPLTIPEDKSITTLWVGGLQEGIEEADLRAKFVGFGPLSSVRMVTQRQCAFVTYLQRAHCEEASRNLHNKLVVNGIPLRLAWGKKRPDSKTAAATPSMSSSAPPPPPSGTTAAPSFPGGMAPPGSAPPPPGGAAVYASQDPRAFSTRLG